MVSLLRAWVQNLVAELRFCKPRSMAIKKKKKDIAQISFSPEGLLESSYLIYSQPSPPSSSSSSISKPSTFYLALYLSLFFIFFFTIAITF